MLTRLEVSRKLTIVQAKAEILSWLKLKKGEGKLRIDLKQENMGPFYEKFEFWNDTEHRRAAAATQRIIDAQKRVAAAREREEEEGREEDEKGKLRGRKAQTGSRGQGGEDDDAPDVQGGCAWWNMDALKAGLGHPRSRRSLQICFVNGSNPC